ncbi:MAG: ABC transporter permease [Anaerolineae bacterium]|nr:ABC transporter permease [Candidatus Roseilinea sp.]MDW8450670.1 ABC transporter permease [Anaerolineae bacterium]
MLHTFGSTEQQLQPAPAIGYAGLIWRRFIAHRLAVAGTILLGMFVLLAIFAPLLSPYSPSEPDLFNQLAPPSLQHPLGTDPLGRDVLTRLLYGARVSLAVGVLSSLISVVIGVVVGAVAGYYGGRVDDALMRLVDLLLAFPAIFLLLILFATIQRSLAIVILFLGLFGWLYLARVVRGEILSLRERDFITAARALGASHRQLIARHLVPNVTGAIIVTFTLDVAINMLAEGTLSFLGFGVPDSTPTWGNMLNGAASYYTRAPLLTIAPGLAITLAVLAVNFIGDGLRDALDPRG